MKNINLTTILFIVFLSAVTGYAQNAKVLDSLHFYGSLRVQVAHFKGDTELQENSPRIGTLITRDINNDTKILAKLEYGIHLIDGVDFNNDADEGFPVFDKKSVNDSEYLEEIGCAYKISTTYSCHGHHRKIRSIYHGPMFTSAIKKVELIHDRTIKNNI